jgi:hypothetical protein
VSFSDSFATCTSTSDLGPNWTTDGIWYCRSTKARGESARTVALANTPAIGDVSVQARVQLTNSTLGSGGVVARASGGNYYAARLLATGKVQLIRMNGSTVTVLGSATARIGVEPSAYTLRLRVTGSAPVQLDVWIGSAAVLSAQDVAAQALTSGQAGLYNGSSARTQFSAFTAGSL